MTRINVVNPKLLTNEWLLAEYRELPRIPNGIREGKTKVNFTKIPKDYVMGTGHMSFFNNKLLYLKNRHKEIVKECIRRDIKIGNVEEIDLNGIPPFLCKDWQPKPVDIETNVQRLVERFDARKRAYHFKTLKIDDEHTFNRYLKVIGRHYRLLTQYHY